jgi:arylsulfatase B
VAWDSVNTIENCTVREGKIGCLFDVLEDPEERVDLAEVMPQKAEEIYLKMKRVEREWYDPDRGDPDERGCLVAERTGYWQPFLD